MADISGESQSMMPLEVFAFIPFIFLPSKNREERELDVLLIFADGV